jgi:D-alanyl-D-alanine carboxypeptidase
MTSTVGDVVKSAVAIGTGRLLSRRAAAQQVAPFTVGLSGMSPAFYYGLGINVAPPWRFQNPFLNGYSGAMAYLPSRRISIAVTTTKGEAGSRVDKGFGEVIFAQIGNYLAPEAPVPVPQ